MLAVYSFKEYLKLDKRVYSVYTFFMMNMKFKNRLKMSYTFLRIASKISEIDKKTRYYGTDEPLFEAEIHMIKSIKENEGIHVTGLAYMLGITKGAVSKTIMKLQHKGMIIKDTDPNNLSRLVLKLTTKGETAYKNHEKLHEKYEALFNDVLKNASEENKKFLSDFLKIVDEKIDTFE